ncbi:MAG: hypothetical protein VXX39_04675, partial [Candidatus Thermoplasmatota archaeon]|nr:hypothetical protein [Candidatus Thermoplasmatota archaeon]
MRRLIAIISVMMLVAITTPTTNALPPEQTDAGALFGGQSSIANNTTALTGELADMPVIVEEYTATWCSNCVDVEMAIKNIADQENIKSYMFHRSIGETQDPFGTDELDERWESRYDRRAPPTAVFNGTEMKIGSVADGENLEEDYTNMARVPLPVEGTSTFTWTPNGMNSGVVTWSNDMSEDIFPSSQIRTQIWIVETTAKFEEGTNGLEDYNKIVRNIFEFENFRNGSEVIDLPDAFDGDDL